MNHIACMSLKCFHKWTTAAVLLASAGGFALSLQAEVRLPQVFSDHMVLQQEKPLTFWGWAQPGETVTVQKVWNPTCTANTRNNGLEVIAANKC